MTKREIVVNRRVIVWAKRVVGHGDGTAREGTPRSPSPPKRSDTAPTAHSHAGTVGRRGRMSEGADARLENGEREGTRGEGPVSQK